jgi:hypothetical protein
MKCINLIIFVSVILTDLNHLSAQIPYYIPTNGLIGWWPFNGNANEESGNGTIGTVNNANLTTDRFGITSSAYSFDGSTSYINTNLTFSPPNITICAWIKTSGTNDYSGIVSSRSLGADITGFVTYNGHIECLLSNGLNNIIYYEDVAGQQQLYDNRWHLCVMTYDGIELKAYVDTVYLGSSNYSILISNIDDFKIGWDDYDQSRFFNGLIDDVCIYDRALTPTEIYSMYNGCQLAPISTINNQTVNINNNSQFIVSSTNPNAIYQWQTDLGTGFQNVTDIGQYNGSTNDTLTIANVTMNNNNQSFRCIINLGSCSDTSNVAILSVNNVLGINDVSQNNGFSIFPNPSQGIINVKAENKVLGANFFIYDKSGKSVLSGTLNSDNTIIDIDELSDGIYLFRIENNTNQTFKIIKE